MNYFQFHIGDYLRDTSHLSLLEHGIYCRLLQTYYTRECGLDDGETARLIGARSKEEREALKTVLNEFFVLEGGVWLHRRCDEEIEKFHDKQSKASRSASARWNKQPAHTERTADAMRTHSEGNAPNNQEPITKNQEREESGVAHLAQLPPAFLGDENSGQINPKARVVLASAWELPGAWGHDAEALGWRPDQILRESEKFRQYWVAGKGQGTRRTLKGWRQSWSNWLSNAEKYAA